MEAKVKLTCPAERRETNQTKDSARGLRGKSTGKSLPPVKVLKSFLQHQSRVGVKKPAVASGCFLHESAVLFPDMFRDGNWNSTGKININIHKMSFCYQGVLPVESAVKGSAGSAHFDRGYVNVDQIIQEERSLVVK